MSRKSAIALRDRLIIADCISKGINQPTQIKNIFENDPAGREISVDSIRKIIREFEDFKRIIFEYPALVENLRQLLGGAGSLEVSYFEVPYEYKSSFSDDVLPGRIAGATLKNIGNKNLSEVHGYLIIDSKKIPLGWVGETQAPLDIPVGSEVLLGITVTLCVKDSNSYDRILSQRYPQTIGAQPRNLPATEGCWVASPGALLMPAEDDSYLPPGEHTAMLAILYDDGKESSQHIRITSPTRWDEPGGITEIPK